MGAQNIQYIIRNSRLTKNKERKNRLYALLQPPWQKRAAKKKKKGFKDLQFMQEGTSKCNQIIHSENIH